jgi:hypothetical protein
MRVEIFTAVTINNTARFQGVLGMVYNTRKCRVSGICPSSGFLEEHKVQWFKSTLHNKPKSVGASSAFHLRMETDPVTEIFVLFRKRDDGQRPETQ